MRILKITIVIFFLFGGVRCIGQESFQKKYYIPKSLIQEIKLQKDTTWQYASSQEKEKIKEKFPLGAEVVVIIEDTMNGTRIVRNDTLIVTQEFYNNYRFKKSYSVDNILRMEGAVLFEKDKIYINPTKVVKEINGVEKKEANSDTSDPEIYVLSLKNNNSVRLRTTEINVTSVTLPLKYRFKSKNRDVSEEFSAGINLNFLVGLSVGKTRFIHREKTGNKTNSWKFTFGGLLGTGTVTLNNSNTSSAGQNALPSGETDVKGLFTTGLGITYSYNKLNLGVFYGWDNSIGTNAKLWNYNGRPWLGFGVGYSLFKL